MIAVLLGCLGPAASTDPPGIFDAVHQEFEDHYALFPVKDSVDWEEGHAAGGELHATSTEAELHAALTELLSPLNDNHVRLLVPADPGGQAPFPDWTSGVLEDVEQDSFRLDNVAGTLDRLEQPHPRFAWGRSGALGYVWIGTEGDAGITALLDLALAELGPVDGLVLDLRANGGGLDAIYQAQAARLVDGAPVYAQTRQRASPAPGDFTDWRDLAVAEPVPEVYRGPMVVLQHRYTVSAAEGFLLALQDRPETRFVGQPSSGAFGTVWWRELGNGWLYSMTVTDVRDVDGVSWEGRGLPVDVEVQSTPEEAEAGVDRALEVGLEMLRVD